MSEIPSLDRFGITPPVFIRKINNKNRWIQHSSDVEDRERKIANNVFNAEKCSLWLVRSDEDFYGFIASISSRRTPQNQSIDFIWFTKKDLDEAGIDYQQISEGDCLAVKHLHYDAIIKRNQAIFLCTKLIKRNQEPERCKKKQTQLVLDYQQKKGCIAITKSSQCQYSNCF